MTPHRQRIVDAVLLAMAARAVELVTKTNAFPSAPTEERELDISSLRQSPLGHDLTDIVSYIEEDSVSQERARQAIRDVLTLLFKGPYMGEDATPPKEFYESDLGRLIGEAYARMYLNDLISPGEAIKRLQVSRQMLSNYVELGHLTPVYLAGRTMYVGSEITLLQQTRKQSSKR